MGNEILSEEYKNSIGEQLLTRYHDAIVRPIVEDILRTDQYRECEITATELSKRFNDMYKDKVEHEQLGDSSLVSRIPELDTELLTIGGNPKLSYYGCTSGFFIQGSNPVELAEQRIQERLDEYDDRIRLLTESDDFEEDCIYHYMKAVVNDIEYTSSQGDILMIPALLDEGKSMTNRFEDHYAWVYSMYFNKTVSIDKKVHDILKDILGGNLNEHKCRGCNEIMIGSKSVCPLCRHKYLECSNCGELTLIDDITNIGGRNICNVCNSKPRCRGCGSTLGEDEHLICYRCSDIRGLLDYHTSLGRQDFSNGSRFKIGYEVEKEDMTARRKLVNKTLIKNTGWVAERDGSLDETGFELISPVLPLDIEVLEETLTPLESLLGAQISERCGGHIHISDTKRTPHEILLDIRGYLPLLYGLYPERAMNEYCEAKEKDSYIDSGHRQALNITRNTLEFRIFPAVKSKDQLLFRTRLIEYMLKHKQADIIKVGEKLLDEDSELYQLLNERVSKSKLKEKAKAFIDFANYLDRDALIIEGKKVKRTITVPKIKIDKERVFEQKALAMANEQKTIRNWGMNNTMPPISERDYGYFVSLVEE